MTEGKTRKNEWKAKTKTELREECAQDTATQLSSAVADYSYKKKMTDVLDNLLTLRPTLRPLIEARSLGEYLTPVLGWKFQPNLFPNAQLFLDHIQKEIGLCYGETIASQVAAQLKNNFTVETGVHISLPRLYDRATVHSIPLNNVNTLTFQATLYSAAARLAAGQAFHISGSSSHIFLSNINSGTYFQPDVSNCLRLQPNKLDKTLQTHLPPLTAEGLDKILRGKKLSVGGQKRAELFRQNVQNHPDNFSRQIATTHAAFYNEVLPPSVRQITFDFEVVVPAYLTALLKDPTSLTYRLFSTLGGRNFLRNGFNDVITAWKTDAPPFDALEIRHGYLQVSHEPYSGSLSPDSLCEALQQKKILPKTALSFILFMLEAGLAPTGGMIHGKKRISQKAIIEKKWPETLAQYYPDGWKQHGADFDQRISALIPKTGGFRCREPESKISKDWRTEAGKLVHAILAGRGDEIADILPYVEVPALKKAEIWGKIVEGDQTVELRLWKAALEEVCNLYNLKNAKRPDRQYVMVRKLMRKFRNLP